MFIKGRFNVHPGTSELFHRIKGVKMTAFLDNYFKNSSNTKISTEELSNYKDSLGIFTGQRFHSYDLVYFGKYHGNAIKWRVLATETEDFNSEANTGRKTMLLDCCYVISESTYGSATTRYRDSNIQKVLSDFWLMNNKVSLKAIAPSYKASPGKDDGHIASTNFEPIENESFFNFKSKFE